jgi:hypothetical protein
MGKTTLYGLIDVCHSVGGNFCTARDLLAVALVSTEYHTLDLLAVAIVILAGMQCRLIGDCYNELHDSE